MGKRKGGGEEELGGKDVLVHRNNSKKSEEAQGSTKAKQKINHSTEQEGEQVHFFITLFKTEGTGGVEQEATKQKTGKEEKRKNSVGKRTVLGVSETRQMKLLVAMYSETLLTLATNTDPRRPD